MKTSPELLKALSAVRAVVPALEENRYMATDLERAKTLVAAGFLVSGIKAQILPDLDA